MKNNSYIGFIQRHNMDKQVLKDTDTLLDILNRHTNFIGKLFQNNAPHNDIIRDIDGAIKSILSKSLPLVAHARSETYRLTNVSDAVLYADDVITRFTRIRNYLAMLEE